MLSVHFPALLIITPLISAPLSVIVRHPLASWIIAIAANSVALLMAIYVFQRAYSGEVIHYALGGWAAPTGIEYYIDTLNAAVLILISLISLFALVYALPAIKKEIDEQRHYLFYAGWLLCLTGLMGIVITGDAFNVFVFLEISSLSMYMLIALGREKKAALLAAFRYLVMGSIGASFILLGIGFLYAATGTLNMLDLGERISQVSDSRTVLVAFTLITLGLLIKTAIFPVYAWLPNAYQYAPSAATIFLAGTASKVSLYILLRFFFHVFGQDYSFNGQWLNVVLLPLSVIGFLVMSIVAIFQTDIRRVLAYSSIAQIGYIVAAISMATEPGLTAGITHLINHALIKAALFMAVGCIIYRIGSAQISDMRYLIQQMPFTVVAFIIAGLSLIGLPLTAGFVSKWHLIGAAIDSSWWVLAAMFLVSSLMAIIYIGKVIEVMCFNTDADNKGVDETAALALPLPMTVSLWALILLSLYTGINASIIVDVANLAATQLLGAMQ